MKLEREQIVFGLAKYFKCLCFYSQRNVEPLAYFIQRSDMIQKTFKRIILAAVLRPDCRAARVESERRLGKVTIVTWERNNSDREFTGCAGSMFVA